jgi:hypothetical protein
MGKRSAQASEAPPKRAKSTAARSPEDVSRSAADQARRSAARAPGAEAAAAAGGAPAAAAPVPTREELLASFNPQEWAQQPGMPDDLAADLKQRFEEALEVYDECWSAVGAPMSKVLALLSFAVFGGLFGFCAFCSFFRFLCPESSAVCQAAPHAALPMCPGATPCVGQHMLKVVVSTSQLYAATSCLSCTELCEFTL